MFLTLPPSHGHAEVVGHGRNVAGPQLPDRSTGHCSSRHPDSLDGLRSIHHLGDRGCLHRHCSIHYKEISISPWPRVSCVLRFIIIPITSLLMVLWVVILVMIALVLILVVRVVALMAVAIIIMALKMARHGDK